MKHEFHDYQISVTPGTSLLAPVDGKENQLLVFRANEIVAQFEWKDGLVVSAPKAQILFDGKKVNVLP